MDELSPDSASKLKIELSQSADIKVKILMDTLWVNKATLAGLLRVSENRLAHVIRKKTSTAAMNVLLNMALNATASDRYTIDWAKKSAINNLLKFWSD